MQQESFNLFQISAGASDQPPGRRHFSAVKLGTASAVESRATRSRRCPKRDRHRAALSAERRASPPLFKSGAANRNESQSKSGLVRDRSAFFVCTGDETGSFTVWRYGPGLLLQEKNRLRYFSSSQRAKSFSGFQFFDSHVQFKSKKISRKPQKVIRSIAKYLLASKLQAFGFQSAVPSARYRSPTPQTACGSV